MTRIAVIGGGAWGSALASTLAQGPHQVSVLVKRQDTADALMAGTSPKLDHQTITPPHLATTEAEKALHDAEIVLTVVPVAATLDAFDNITRYAPDDAVVGLTAKGLFPDGASLQQELAQKYLRQCAVMFCGPSFADEVVAGKPCALVAASNDKNAAQRLAEQFRHSHVRVYIGTDPIGVAVASSVKNVIAIAAGITIALGLGDNARAALITRGLAEATRLAVALGGKKETLFGLAGVGDMILTCTDSHSRNYAYGLALGGGGDLPERLAEGAHTAAALAARAISAGVDAPIIAAVDRAVNRQSDITREIQALLARPADQEWNNGGT